MSTSPITADKNRLGYVSATQRKRCGSCTHALVIYGGSWQCRKGAFMVTVYAICDHWQLRQPPGFVQPGRETAT